MRRALLVLLAALALALIACRSKSSKETAFNAVADQAPEATVQAVAATEPPTLIPVEPTPPPPPTPTPEPEPPPPVADPVRVRIPRINVDARIVPVGVNYRGEMDSPKDAWSVAWFAPGFKPDEPGNAVLAGHVDYIHVGPAVFYNIRLLKPGDKIVILAADSKEYEFEVKAVEQYLAGNAPLERIFGENPNKGLNLVTCTGNFNSGTLEYDQRVVVYAEEVKPPPPPRVPRGI
jgi:sortase (surface protein transpeptidase)